MGFITRLQQRLGIIPYERVDPRKEEYRDLTDAIDTNLAHLQDIAGPDDAALERIKRLDTRITAENLLPLDVGYLRRLVQRISTSDRLPPQKREEYCAQLGSVAIAKGHYGMIEEIHKASGQHPNREGMVVALVNAWGTRGDLSQHPNDATRMWELLYGAQNNDPLMLRFCAAAPVKKDAQPIPILPPYLEDLLVLGAAPQQLSEMRKGLYAHAIETIERDHTAALAEAPMRNEELRKREYWKNREQAKQECEQRNAVKKPDLGLVAAAILAKQFPDWT